MFEHLDDPSPPVAGSQELADVTQRIDRMRRARAARSLMGAAAVALVVVGAVTATQVGVDPVVEVPTGAVYDVPDPGTTTPAPPPGVTGHRANRLETAGPLDGWLLETYPIPVAGEAAFLRLGVRDRDGPTPRPVSVDFGDGTTARPVLPPCPPADSIPEPGRTGEHVYLSFERDAAGRPSFWNHAYASPRTYVLTMVFERGCGSPSNERSTASFELTVHAAR